MVEIHTAAHLTSRSIQNSGSLKMTMNGEHTQQNVENNDKSNSMIRTINKQQSL